MQNKIDQNIQVKYKYALAMGTNVDKLKQVVNKWSKQYLDKIYLGQLLLLVSPIYLLKDDIFIQPLIDIDDEFDKAFLMIKKFINKNKVRQKYWISEYSGKNSFHIVARFAIKVKNYDLDYMRKLIFNPLDIDKTNIDMISSVRDVPVVRLGYRREINKIAIPTFPIFNYNIKQLKSLINSATYRHIFKDKLKLSDYIRNYMFPLFYIEEKDYVKYI